MSKASQVLRGQKIFQDENNNIHHAKANAKAKTMGEKESAATRKDGARLASRKALNDITNKSRLQPGTSSKVKSVKEEFNVAEERFLHDHSKCVEEQRKMRDAFDLDLVLPGYGSMSNDKPTKFNKGKIDVESLDFCDEPEEMSMSEFSDWLQTTSRWCSPPCSPLHWESPPSSPLSWQFEAVEFKLRVCKHQDCRNKK